MIIEKYNYKNDALYNEFVKKYKKSPINCEVTFEHIYNLNKEVYDAIRVWFPSSFYGTSYIIKNGIIEVRHIDYDNNYTTPIEGKNVADLIMEDIKLCEKKSL